MEQAAQHRPQFVSIRQLQIESHRNFVEVKRQRDRLTRQQTGGSGSAVDCSNLPKLSADGGILQMWSEILEPKHRFYCQAMKMLKDGQRRRGHLITEC